MGPQGAAVSREEKKVENKEVRILVVDDELPARNRLKDLLEDCRASFPFELVGEASNGRETIDLLKQHNVDILFLGMECEGAPMSWLYGPLLTKPLSRKNDQSRRFDGSTSKKGMEIVDILNPASVYVYAMGQEPWCTFLTSIQYTDESKPIVESNRLVEECRGRGIESERLYGKREMHIEPR